MNMRIFALLYGPHHALHRRLLRGFASSVPKSVPLTLWLNGVPDSTRRSIDFELDGFQVLTFDRKNENVHKYVAMRTMFQGFKETAASGEGKAFPEDWAVWFDDDSHIARTSWYSGVRAYSLAHPGARYIGQPWFAHWRRGQWDWVVKQPWYSGLSSEIINGKPGVSFAQGAYWLLRSDAIRDLDWPLNLDHNGGDVMLGEACRQRGFHFHKFYEGVKINDAPRRGFAEAPAGCVDRGVRV